MPIYEYHCSHCAENFEVTQRITDDPLHTCPRCEGPVEKLISQSSFVLKGGGWYKTDYAAKGEPKKADKPADKPAACAANGSKAACSGCPGAGG